MLCTNNSVFRSGGKIGRLMFLRNILLIALVAIPIVFCSAYIAGCILLPGTSGVICAILAIVPSICFYLGCTFMTVFKRLRDIRNVEDPSWWWILILYTPIAGLILSAYLYSHPGQKVEGQDL